MDVYAGPVNFNSEVVKKNKIKSIVLDIVDKPDGSIIIDKGATQGFDFDVDGKLVRYYYTMLNRIEKEEVDVPAIKKRGRIIRPATTRTVTHYFNDTIFTNIFYDEQNRIISRRVQAGDYYDAYYYEYNEQGKIKKEMHTRETSVGETKYQFKLGVQKILSSETFEYETLTPTQVKKKCLNDEGREYKKAIINYDAAGNKLSEGYDFIVSWMRQESKYEYNTVNLMTKRVFTSNESGDVKDESTFEYDGSGILITEKKIKNTEVLNEISYLFDEAKLVKSHINRDFKNSSIGIVKYAYTFY